MSGHKRLSLPCRSRANKHCCSVMADQAASAVQATVRAAANEPACVPDHETRGAYLLSRVSPRSARSTASLVLTEILPASCEVLAGIHLHALRWCTCVVVGHGGLTLSANRLPSVADHQHGVVDAVCVNMQAALRGRCIYALSNARKAPAQSEVVQASRQAHYCTCNMKICGTPRSVKHLGAVWGPALM